MCRCLKNPLSEISFLVDLFWVKPRNETFSGTATLELLSALVPHAALVAVYSVKAVLVGKEF